MINVLEALGIPDLCHRHFWLRPVDGMVTVGILTTDGLDGLRGLNADGHRTYPNDYTERAAAYMDVPSADLAPFGAVDTRRHWIYQRLRANAIASGCSQFNPDAGDYDLEPDAPGEINGAEPLNVTKWLVPATTTIAPTASAPATPVSTATEADWARFAESGRG